MLKIDDKPTDNFLLFAYNYYSFANAHLELNLKRFGIS